LLGKSISQGRRGSFSREVIEEAGKPKREGDLFGETPLLAHCKASKASGSLGTRKGHRRKYAVEGRRSLVHTGLGAVERLSWRPWVSVRSHPASGAARSLVSLSRLTGRESAWLRSGGSEIRRCRRRKLERVRVRKSIGAQRWETSVAAYGFTEGIKLRSR